MRSPNNWSAPLFSHTAKIRFFPERGSYNTPTFPPKNSFIMNVIQIFIHSNCSVFVWLTNQNQLPEKCCRQKIANYQKSACLEIPQNGMGYEIAIFFSLTCFTLLNMVYSRKLIYLLKHIYRFQNPTQHLNICPPLIWDWGVTHNFFFMELL